MRKQVKHPILSLSQVFYTYRPLSEGITENILRYKLNVSKTAKYAFKQVNSSRATDVSFYFLI